MIEIPVLLTNRWATFNVSPTLQVKLKEFFRYRPPNYQFSWGYQNGGDGYKHLFLRGRVSSGLFLEKRKELEAEYRLEVADERIPLEFKEIDLGDREYQQNAHAALIKASSNGGIILAATASGKTRIAGNLFKSLVGKGVFIVDELTLLEQTRLALKKVVGEAIGVVGRSEFKPRRITVASIQTLHKHRDNPKFKDWFKSLDVVFIDELHVMINRRNIDMIQRIKPRAVFGLTGTLQIEKEHVRLPAIALAGPVIFTYDIKQGAEEGYLSRGVIGRVRFKDPLPSRLAPGYWTERVINKQRKKVFVKPGSPDAEYRYRVTLNKARNDLIESLTREGVRRGRRVVVLFERKLHLRVLGKRLMDVPHQSISGEVETLFRFRAMKKMDAGQLPLILASRVFSKGVDVKSVDLIIDATALPGRNAALQRYGRGARKVGGKNGLIYIDISDVGNSLARAAKQRQEALKETGSPVVDISWQGIDAETVFFMLEKELKKYAVS